MLTSYANRSSPLGHGGNSREMELELRIVPADMLEGKEMNLPMA